MRYIGAIVLALVLAAPISGRADDADPEQALIAAGIEKRDAGDLQGALQDFTEAYEIGKNNDLNYHLGMTLYALGELSKAQQSLEQYLSAGGDALSADLRSEVESTLYKILKASSSHYHMGLQLYEQQKWIEAEVELSAYLQEQGADVNDQKKAEVQALIDEMLAEHIAVVTFSCNVEGASLYIDGKFLSLLPLGDSLKLVAGDYRIDIQAQGYASAGKDVKIEAGETKAFKIVLLPEKKVALSCDEYTCSGVGTCSLATGAPRCECKHGYEVDATGRECLPTHTTVSSTKVRAVFSVVLSSIGIALVSAGLPILLEVEFEPGIAMLVSSFVTTSVGVPLAVETYSRSLYVSGRTGRAGAWRGVTLASFSAAGVFTAPAFMGIPPFFVLAPLHIVVLGFFGIGLGIKAYKNVEDVTSVAKPDGLKVRPFYAAVEGGGAVMGLGGVW